MIVKMDKISNLLLMLVILPDVVKMASIDIPIISKMNAPLKAELDTTNFTKLMREAFHSELASLKDTIQTTITKRLENAEARLAMRNNASITETVSKEIGIRKTLGCQSGTAELGYSNPAEAAKTKTTTITFSPSFLDKPALTYGFMKLDTDKNHNVRIYVQISHLTKNGFTMRIASWGTTRIYNAVVSWMACPKFL